MDSETFDGAAFGRGRHCLCRLQNSTCGSGACLPPLFRDTVPFGDAKTEVRSNRVSNSRTNNPLVRQATKGVVPCGITDF